MNFSFTQAAATKIKEISEKDNTIRIEVSSGGCSGFQYKYIFEAITPKSDDDFEVELDGSKVLIDSMSMQFLNDSILDYKIELGQEGFEIKNPNTTAKCGCGNSFSI